MCWSSWQRKNGRLRQWKILKKVVVSLCGATKFYIRLAMWSPFQFLLTHIIFYFPNKRPSYIKRHLCDRLMKVLTRLILNLQVQDLVYRLGFLLSAIYKWAFQKLIDVMFHKYSYSFIGQVKQLLESVCTKYSKIYTCISQSMLLHWLLTDFIKQHIMCIPSKSYNLL